MKQKLQGLLSGILVGAVITGGAVCGKSGSEMIEAFYSDIKIFIDGKELIPTDVSGAVAEPFIYNGTTYLPARAIGEALGKEVRWDAEKKQVILNEPKSTPLPEATPTQTATPVPTPTITPKPTESPTPMPTPTPETPANMLSTKKILQISGYREDAIKGEVQISLGNGQEKPYFRANLTCNNGGLADYVTCKIDLTEVISTSEQEFRGYFRVQHNNTVRYDRLEGTVSILDSKIVLHTQEYDYHLVAELPKTVETKAEKSVSSMLMAVQRYNGETASGILSLDFNANKSDASLKANFSVGEQKYILQSEAVTEISNAKLSGSFSLLCNGEALVKSVSGTLESLQAPLGGTLTLTIPGNITLECLLTETVLN